jgi:hypothetical protein
MPRKAKAARGATSKAPQAAKAAGAPSTNGGESVAGYFRRIFKENPQLLQGRSNDELFRRWLADHPGEPEVPRNVKVGLQNVKGLLRSKGRRRRKAKAAVTVATAPVSQRAEVGVKKSKLEALEERIDDTLTFARGVDEEGLHDVISHLRRARNEVVWKMGQ